MTDAANYDAPLLGMLIIAEAVTNHAKMPMDSDDYHHQRQNREVRSHFWQIALTVVCGTGLGLLLCPMAHARAAVRHRGGRVCGNWHARCSVAIHSQKQVTQASPGKKTASRIARMFMARRSSSRAPCLLLVDPPQRFFSPGPCMV